VRAIILAAGLGRRLLPQTETTPKCLLEIGGRPLLARCLEALAGLGISEAVVVVGHRGEDVAALATQAPAALGVRIIRNTQFASGSLLSLWHARYELEDEVLIVEGDVLYPRELLARLLASPDPNTLAVDEKFQDTGDEPKVVCEDGWVVEVSRKSGRDARVRGEAVGLLRLSAAAADVLQDVLEEMVATGMDGADYEEALRELAAEVPIGTIDVGDLPWLGIDLEEDLARARQQIFPEIERLDRGEVVVPA
jgi:choline kinase